MATHDIQNVTYLRKDEHFLADGTWYISTPCPKCGLVDEEVSWDDAKTPHHAGLIADARHFKCNAMLDEEANRADARSQVEVARAQLKHFETLAPEAQEELIALEAEPEPEEPSQKRLYRMTLEAAREKHSKCIKSVVESRQRVKDIEEANRWAL